MAFVPDTRWRAFDSNGDPASGATLTVYTAGTTTPASIYRDAALVTPMSNPTSGSDVADSAGYFPQIFAASSGLYDIILKNAAGVTITTYLSVPSIGTSSSGLSLDFTNSRYQVRGSGGTVYLEAGDPTGDDVGGTGRLGGWNGTQADSWTVDAALFNVTGRIKENSFKIPGVIRTAATTFTSVASVDIPLTNDPTGVLAWDIDIINLKFSAANNPGLRFSYDGGATYVSTGTYSHDFMSVHNTTSNFGGAQGGTTALLGSAVETTATLPGMMQLRIVTQPSGTLATLFSGRMETPQNPITPSGPMTHVFGGYETTGGRATHVRFFPSTGTTSGLYRVVPLRGFGET